MKKGKNEMEPKMKQRVTVKFWLDQTTMEPVGSICGNPIWNFEAEMEFLVGAAPMKPNEIAAYVNKHITSDKFIRLNIDGMVNSFRTSEIVRFEIRKIETAPIDI